MAFGQSSGPPATGKQVAALSALVQAAGHRGWRDARGPLGLTQRQAAGKFTRDEADELIARLQAEADGTNDEGTAAVATGAPVEPPPVRPPRTVAASTAATAPSAAERAVRGLPTALLAAELQRRGWIVVEP